MFRGKLFRCTSNVLGDSILHLRLITLYLQLTLLKCFIIVKPQRYSLQYNLYNIVGNL